MLPLARRLTTSRDPVSPHTERVSRLKGRHRNSARVDVLAASRLSRQIGSDLRLGLLVDVAFASRPSILVREFRIQIGVLPRIQSPLDS